jgi:hypothetical protein
MQRFECHCLRLFRTKRQYGRHLLNEHKDARGETYVSEAREHMRQLRKRKSA